MKNILEKRSFMLMEVIDINNKRLGYINDFLLDCRSGKINGFAIDGNMLFSKSLKICCENILYFNDKMIVKGAGECQGLPLSTILNMDIVDKEEKILGIVENILFRKSDFTLYGIVVKNGIIKSLFDGKRIIRFKDIIIGDKNIFYFGDNRIKLLTLAHNFSN